MNTSQISACRSFYQSGLTAHTTSLNPSLASGQPVIITGMHKSGTSLTASILQAAGVNIGENLMGPGPGNPLGHFEDLALYGLHCNILRAQRLHADGWTTQTSVPVPDSFLPHIQAFIANRRQADGLWGWKEPRTTLFLDFWQQRLPNAKFVFAYRSPWEVVDSLFRRGDRTFIDNPKAAVETWVTYNTAILDFAQRHRSACFLFDIEHCRHHEQAVLTALIHKLGIELGLTAQAKYKPKYKVGLLTQMTDAPQRATYLNQHFPQVTQLYKTLGAIADMPPLHELPLMNTMNNHDNEVCEIHSEKTETYLQSWRLARKAQREEKTTQADNQQAMVFFQQLQRAQQQAIAPASAAVATPF